MTARKAPLIGLFGRPFIDLGHLLDEGALAEMDREITRGLVRATPLYTGGSLKWMGVVAPWQMEDGYPDLMHAVERMSYDEIRELAALAEPPFVPRQDEPVRFGDETEHPLSLAQMRWLSFRYGVYFPWKVCVHLLENDRWEDKHTGAGKDFTEEAKALFPKTVERIKGLPFREIGRVVIFGLEPNDHAPLHRDTEPGKALTVAQSISIDPRGTKRFYLQNAEEDEPLIVGARVYWFNDMDYHGVMADTHFRYSIRVDGVFEASFLRDVERARRR